MALSWTLTIKAFLRRHKWWSLSDGTYMARGIFGQGIFIDPSRNLVIASNSNWPQATDAQGGDQEQQRLAFYRQVQLATTPSPTH
jgi:CubicO group peptidase (beta-lactamase class C family)